MQVKRVFGNKTKFKQFEDICYEFIFMVNKILAFILIALLHD